MKRKSNLDRLIKKKKLKKNAPTKKKINARRDSSYVKFINWKYRLYYAKSENKNYYLYKHVPLNVSIRQLN